MSVKDLKQIDPWDWPENAGEVVLKTLRNNRSAPSDRMIAAELAGDLTIMDDQMADGLLSIVGNGREPEQLRAQAAISLGPALEQTDIEGFDDDLAEPPISQETFQSVQEALRKTYSDEGEPKLVRRRALEASVRAPQDWHPDAIRAAYSTADEDWKLTAVFCMRWIPGFENETLEMLKSRNPDIHFEAVRAAGEQELDAAWPHVAALLASKKTEKRLLLAAIEAAPGISPEESRDVLSELADSSDEEIADAARDAMAEQGFGEDDEDDDLLR